MKPTFLCSRHLRFATVPSVDLAGLALCAGLLARAGGEGAAVRIRTSSARQGSWEARQGRSLSFEPLPDVSETFAWRLKLRSRILRALFRLLS